MRPRLKSPNGLRDAVTVFVFGALAVGLLIVALFYPWSDDTRIATEGLQRPQQESTGKAPAQPSPGGVPLPPAERSPPQR